MSTSLSRRPVLVGIGVAMQREDDPARALDPLGLMVECARRAVRDAGASTLAARIGHVAVPRGRWTFGNPARAIADALGAPSAKTVLSTVGVLQQTLIAQACAAIARGEVDAALVAGADCGWRLSRADSLGLTLADPDPTADSPPDETLSPKDELRHPAELRAGLKMPIGLYAIQHSAVRAAKGQTLAAQRDAIAALYERFSRIAADNPHAWSRTPVPAATIREAGRGNTLIAFPYNKLHCSNWSVDQGAALLLCAEHVADEAGVPRDRRIHPLASAESNHMVACCARAQLHRFPGWEVTARRVLEAAQLDGADLDLVDLYTSFPIAPEVTADALGLAPGRDWTVTGGMSFAGGPYNNYVFQSTARLAELLRAGAGRHGAISCVSGVITKQAIGIWSREPAAAPFVHQDVSDEVARHSPALPVDVVYEGPGVIVGSTVVNERAAPARGVAVVDIPGGRRTVATMTDERVVAAMLREEFCGRAVQVRADGTCLPAHDTGL
jgi:acetyl-CoA C-acetyltransferase